MVVRACAYDICGAQDEEGEDLPTLEETVDEGSRMEEVSHSHSWQASAVPTLPVRAACRDGLHTVSPQNRCQCSSVSNHA